MTGKSKETRDEYFNLMNALADSAIEMSDDEIESQIAEEGDKTEEIRTVFVNAVRLAKQNALFEAKKQYAVTLTSFQKLKFEIPETLKEKRDMIHSLLDRMSSSQQHALTSQFREFERLADEDLDSMLMQLLALEDSDKHGT